MARIPSARIRKKSKSLNLIPFADSVLVFVFFILMSATFYHVNDLGAGIAIENLNQKTELSLKITSTELTLLSSGNVLERFQRLPKTGEFSVTDIKAALKQHSSSSKAITLEPDNEMSFEEISNVLEIVKRHFPNIIFGNLK